MQAYNNPLSNHCSLRLLFIRDPVHIRTWTSAGHQLQLEAGWDYSCN